MVVIPGLSQPLEAVGKHITWWDEGVDGLAVGARSVVRQAACPRCACGSSRPHGRYRRRLADSPCLGRPVLLDIETRRFKCLNPGCPQRTFSERIDALAASGQRRTLRLGEALRSLGYALGGAAAARLAGRLGMPVSGDAVLRGLRRAGCAPLPAVPVVIGIDDWALARGHRYGTIIVDLERRRPIDLLPSREAAPVAGWLHEHPTVEVIARDRAGAYADAARTAAPAAQQVADRWHLLANLRDALERVLLRHTASLREAARQASEALRLDAASAALSAETADVAAPTLRVRARCRSERRAWRLAHYEEVVRRRQLGEPIRAIGRSLDLDCRTVRKFLRAGAFPERAPRAPVATLLDAHRQYLAARAAEGCRNAMQVWRELKDRGFTGGRSIVRDAFAQLRGALPDSGRLHTVAAAVRTMAPPSTRRACAWVLGWQQPKLEEPERSDRRRFVETLCRIEPSIAAARPLAHRFLGLVRNRNLEGFERWLPEAQACAVPEMQRFAQGLEADLPAVRSAFSSPWSSGQVEGQVNRLKYLKRQMYGRAKLDLLRIRVLHPN